MNQAYSSKHPETSIKLVSADQTHLQTDQSLEKYHFSNLYSKIEFKVLSNPGSTNKMMFSSVTKIKNKL